jgi:ABC-type multidrug transport system permease subunit
MSDASRWMIALAFISLPTIAFGGYFLLSILKRQKGTEKISAIQRDYFRAGHAHAGVLVILSVIGQLVLDYSLFNDTLVWAMRIGLFVAPLLISAGFFGGAPRTAEAKPGSLVKLIPIGALVMSLSTLGVGLSLLFAL